MQFQQGEENPGLLFMKRQASEELINLSDISFIGLELFDRIKGEVIRKTIDKQMCNRYLDN